jgi:hypothetical protein
MVVIDDEALEEIAELANDRTKRNFRIRERAREILRRHGLASLIEDEREW